MTATPLEDRIRAHFADRTANEPLPGGDIDTALADLRRSAETEAQADARSVSIAARTTWLATAAAAFALLAAAAVAVVVMRQDDGPVSTTPGPDGDPTTTVSPSTTASPNTTVATTTSAPPPPSDTPTLVLGGGGPLGGWDGERWVDGDAWSTGLGFTGHEAYQHVRLGQPPASGTSILDDYCVISGDDQPRIPVDGLPGVEGPWDAPGIGVIGVDRPLPRPVEVLDPGAATYVDDAREVLAGLGIVEASPQVKQVVRGDIDGDGTDEVLVVVERIADPENLSTDPDDYSVVYLRRLVDGEVQDTVVSSVVHPTGNDIISTHRIDAVADLNGDGRMEVAVMERYYEGFLDRAWELRSDGGLEQAFLGGCGS